MAVYLVGTDEAGHPLEGRVAEKGTCVVLYTGSQSCAIDELVRELLERAAGEDGQYVVVDADDEPLCAQHFKVRVLPTWQVWVDGSVKRNVVGATNLAQLEDLLGVGGIERKRGMRRRR